MDDLGTLYIGTLVLHNKGEVHLVRQLEMTRVAGSMSNGPQYIGKINGISMKEYSPLVITVPLLAALGWRIDDESEKNVIRAKPSPGKYLEAEEADSFEITFVLEDNDSQHLKEGEVFTYSGKQNLLLSHFHDLDNNFHEEFSLRLVHDFKEEDFKIPQQSSFS